MLFDVPMNLPAVLIEGEHVALVFDAGDGVGVSVTRREYFVQRIGGLSATIRVLRTVVPHQRYHHLSWNNHELVTCELNSGAAGWIFKTLKSCSYTRSFFLEYLPNTCLELIYELIENLLCEIIFMYLNSIRKVLNEIEKLKCIDFSV